jgi:hypothetical protein
VVAVPYLFVKEALEDLVELLFDEEEELFPVQATNERVNMATNSKDTILFIWILLLIDFI